MAICYLNCDEDLTHLIKNFRDFEGQEFVELHLPITASEVEINLLITGPKMKNLTRLAATISDWNSPPATLFILPEAEYEERSERLSYHPRVGRSIFFCKDSEVSIHSGLNQIHAFDKKRGELPLDNSITENFNISNTSPRWLFQTLMEHLDEYIYFKDTNSRFLAVSRYLVESAGKDKPENVLGKTDHDFFDKAHADIAFSDERKIATGELEELHKEEAVVKNGKTHWVASRKLPLRTRSGYLAGTFGLSRDVTEEKELHEQLKENHARMQEELLLARNLQSTLMQPNIPKFMDSKGQSALEIATQYIPSFHLSGDFFSITETVDGGAGILVADVMGHGVRAAMVTAMIQIAKQQLQPYANNPAQFMSRLNEIMKRTMQPTGQTIFATAVYCHIDLNAKQLTYSQAGACHGVSLPASKEKSASVFSKNSINPALGLISGVQYAEEKMLLETGDEIILYTDGIIEAGIGEEEYSEARMLDFLMRHRRSDLPDMLEALLSSVHNFTQSKHLDDDVCLLALRIV
ncbi:MAG: SpoIIE family protein phosphatase [Opitutaceae bacterium]